MEDKKPNQPQVYKEDPPDPNKKAPVPEKKENEPAEDVEEKSPSIEPPKMKAESKQEQKIIVNEQDQDQITNDTTFPVAESEENK